MATQFSDGIAVGRAGVAPDNAIPGNILPTGNPGANGVSQAGVTISPTYVYQITPAALQANNIALAQTVSGANLALTAGTGVTSTTLNFQGTTVTVLDLGVERSVRLIGASGATATNVTVTGYDMYGVRLTNTFSGPGSGATVESTKTVRFVESIFAAGNTTQNVTAGTGDTYGLPYRAPNFASVIINWNNTLVTAATGFNGADATSPATATTTATRGRYTVQSAASDGTRVLTVWQFVSGADSVTGAFGVTQA